MGEKEEEKKTDFKPFKVTTKKRYWEDEDFGILIKRDKDFTIYPKHLRSYMLKFAIVRGDVVLLEKEKVIFAFKGRIISVVGGFDKNLLTIIGENGKKVNKTLDTKKTINSVKDRRVAATKMTDDEKNNNKNIIVVADPNPKIPKQKVQIIEDKVDNTSDELPETFLN